jgi:hypothetical protein
MHLGAFSIENAPTLAATGFCPVATGPTLVVFGSRQVATGSFCPAATGPTLVVIGLRQVAIGSFAQLQLARL